MTAQTIPFPTGEAAELFGLLTRQRDLYDTLNGLASQQASLIAEGKTEALLSVLSKRQGLIEELGQINDDIGPYRGRIPEIAESLPEPNRQELRGLVDQVQSLLKTIIDQDEQDRIKLEQAKADVGGQLTQTARTGMAINAYKQPVAPASARFTDRAG